MDNPAATYLASLPDRVRTELCTPPVGSKWRDLRRLHRDKPAVYESEVAVALWRVRPDLPDDWVEDWELKRNFTRDQVHALVHADVFRARHGRVGAA